MSLLLGAVTASRALSVAAPSPACAQDPRASRPLPPFPDYDGKKISDLQTRSDSRVAVHVLRAADRDLRHDGLHADELLYVLTDQNPGVMLRIEPAE